MNPLSHLKKIIDTYKKIDSPSKKILKYGGFIALSLMLLSGIFFAYSSYAASSYYLELAAKSAKSGANIMILVLISMFVLDIVYEN